MKRLVLVAFLFAGLFCAGFRFAIAAPAAQLESASSLADLSRDFAVYEDATGTQGLAQAKRQRFVPVNRVELKHPHSTYWLRFQYVTENDRDWLLTAGYRPSTADLYVEGIHGVQHSGDTVPYAQRPVQFFNWVAFVLPAAATPRTAYVRIATYEPLVNLVAYTPERFHADVTRDIVVIAALLGVLGSLALSSIILFFVMRDTLYLYYAVYIVAQIFYRANDFGLISAYALPHLSFPYVRTEVIFDGITLIAATAFIRRFLRSHSYNRTLDRVNVAIAAVGAAYALLALAGVPIRYTLVQNFSFVYVPIWIATGVVCWRKGYAPARLFLYAWTAYMIGIVLEAAVDLGMAAQFGIVRESGPDVILDYVVYLGIALESILLSLSLAQAYRTANEEKIASLHELIAMRERTERMAHLAYSDALTNLPNRVAFFERIDESLRAALRHEWKCALLYIDVNDFKGVNDTFGHQAGDSALIEAGARLRKTIRGDEMVGRIAGDEFAVFLPSMTSEDEAVSVVDRIMDAFEEPFDLDGHLVTISVSIGVSYFPDPCPTREALFASADAAMYARKASIA